MSVVNYDQDNLLTATVKLVTSDSNASAYQVESGESVVRGEVLKIGTTGLVALADPTDTPFTVALQTVDATLGAETISYMVEGSVDQKELTFAVGDADDFRDGLRDSGIVLEG